MTQIMVDLETYGTSPGCVIVAIGAVKFGGGKILEEPFYEKIDAQSCIDVGMRVELGAVEWWLKQPDTARLELTRPGVPIRQALEWFSAWVADRDAEVWGNGATFDNVVLAAAYDILRMPRPWHFTKDRCYRTVKSLRLDVPFVRSGTYHNALDDARSQAVHLMEILDSITIPHA